MSKTIAARAMENALVRMHLTGKRSLKMQPQNPSLSPVKKPKPEPVVSAIRKARREFKRSPAGQLQTLLDEESRWKRKETIARNKLAEVRGQIVEFARGLVEPKSPETP